MPAPPVAERRPEVLRAHGDDRPDDWFWLRDRDDPAVLAHLEAENAHTEASLAHLGVLRDRLYEEILARIVETDLSVPVRRGPWWYYQRTQEGKSYPVHCRRPARPGQSPPLTGTDEPVPDEEVLLDQNTLAQGHDYLEVANLAVSPDHRWLAYAVDANGSERYGLRFRRLGGGGPDGRPETAEPTEEVPDTYYGLAWANDNATVFYTRVDEAMRPHQLWRHRLGTDPAADVLVHTEPDQRFTLGVGRSKDGALIVVALSSTSTSEMWVVPAGEPERAPRLIAARRHGVEYGVEHVGDGGGGPGWFVILTNDDALDFRLMTAPADDPGRPQWTELVPHRPGTRVEDVDVIDRWLVLSERGEAEAGLRVVPLGPPRPGPPGPDLLAQSWVVAATEHPSTTWEGPNPEHTSTLLRYEQTSLLTPRTVLDLDLETRTPTLLRRQPVRGPYDPARYVTYRLWAPADGDGPAIPISVVHRADLSADPGAGPDGPLTGPAPCLLYGYGAYEYSIDPAFSSMRLCLLERGAVFAIAHVRGGGEMGRAWYEHGKLAEKPNTFDDFIACARHLVGRGMTTPGLLAARGGSAGGLLIGAVANRAPDLFRALVAEVPFVDCLTTMLDDTLPLTVGEWEEWGNPVEDPAAYRLMKGYSPYDNVVAVEADGRARRYPDLYVTAGLNDPRVGFWEPAKWVQRLRAANPGNRVLLRTELGAGHGGPSGRYDSWRDEAQVLAFLLDALGLAGTEPRP